MFYTIGFNARYITEVLAVLRSGDVQFGAGTVRRARSALWGGANLH